MSKAIFNAYAEAGGNFIDTADIYQFGQSEELLGSLLEGRRENFVLATKFTRGAVPNADRLVTGNSRKAMVASVEASLKRLKTERIDICWVHYPDKVTPAEEIVRGFEDLARAGKILYAGLSNFPAWRLARAVTLAELSHSVPIAAAQFEHSLVHREPEADLFPASEALRLGIVTWSPLGGGMLTGKYRKGEKGRAESFGGRVFQPENSAQRTQILDTVLATVGRARRQRRPGGHRLGRNPRRDPEDRSALSSAAQQQSRCNRPGAFGGTPRQARRRQRHRPLRAEKAARPMGFR
jgi:aryl-alcohol dehydrogenase-like predicted oxidoreductase